MKQSTCWFSWECNKKANLQWLNQTDYCFSLKRQALPGTGSGARRQCHQKLKFFISGSLFLHSYGQIHGQNALDNKAKKKGVEQEQCQSSVPSYQKTKP